MGYGNTGPFGPKLNKTLNLDRMAAEGMKLTSFYVAAPVCTPSRAALITGCYPKRVGMARRPPVWLQPGDTVEVRVERIGMLCNPVKGEGG